MKANRISARGPLIPAAPFVAWLEHRIHEAESALFRSWDKPRNDSEFAITKYLAEEIGVAERTLWRYRSSLDSCGRPTDEFRRRLVEDMLARAGVDFYAVYQQFEGERDIDLEPDAFCRLCGELVTPIQGRCPWDDCLLDSARLAA